MSIEEALEEFNFFNEGDYITREMSIAKDIVLKAYETLKDEDFSKRLSIDELVIELEKEKEKNRILESKNIRLCDDNLELIKQSPYDKKLHYKYVEIAKTEPQWYGKEE